MAYDFSTIKLGFVRWLQEHSTTNEEKLNVNDDVSIFSYAEEFKEYMQSQYSTNPIGMNINDLLSLNILNGELVVPDTSTVDEFVPETLADEADVNAQEPNDEQTADIIPELLNNFFQDDNFKTLIDTNSDGNVSQDEIEQYLKNISGIDGNQNDISLDDIIGSMENFMSRVEEVSAEELNIESTNDVADEVKAENSTSPLKNSSNNSSNVSSNYQPTSNTSKSPQKKSLDAMNESELNAELKTANSTLSTKQEELSAAIDGSSPALSALKENIETAYKTYHDELEKVDKGMAKDLDKLKTSIDNKQNEVNEADKEISKQTSVVSNCETAYNNAVSTRENLEAALSALNGTDTKDMSSEQKSEISAKISDLQQNKIPAAKQAEEKAKQDLEDAKNALNDLNDKKEELVNGEGGLNKLQEQMTALEEKISAKHPEIQQYLQAYNEAKTNYDAERTKEISAAQKAVKTAQDYVNEVQTVLNANQNKQLIKEYSADQYDEEEGQRLVDTAKAMLSKYGTSHGYCATGVSRTINMAYGIRMNGNGCDWDTNMEKLVDKGMFAEVTGDYSSASELKNLPAGAIVCWEATGGHNGGGAQYGHVTVADGHGGEISDHYQSSIYTNIGGRSDTYRIFIPV